jgi:hypothetical protein
MRVATPVGNVRECWRFFCAVAAVVLASAAGASANSSGVLWSIVRRPATE